MADADVLPMKPFPQIARRKALQGDFLRGLYGGALNNEALFRWVNRDLIRAYREVEVPAPGDVGERIVRDLTKHGIALADFSEFFPASAFEGLKAAFAGYKAAFDRERAKSKKKLKGKQVYLDTVHKAHTFGVGDPASDYLAAPVFAAIAAAYMGMVPRFVGSSFWHTKPAPSEDRVGSQLWHRDYNDRRLTKVFLYLNDVGQKNGCFEYVTGSHAMGPLGRLYDRIGPDGLRAYPEQAPVAAMVDSLPRVELQDVPFGRRTGGDAPWTDKPTLVRCQGPAGTMIVCDTFGVHRGGYVEEGFRDMVMLTYSTDFNVHEPHFAVTRPFAERLSPFGRIVFGLEGGA